MCIKVHVCFFSSDASILKGEHIPFLTCFLTINNFDFRLKYNDVINNFIWVKFAEDNFFIKFSVSLVVFLYILNFLILRILNASDVKCPFPGFFTCHELKKNMKPMTLCVCVIYSCKISDQDWTKSQSVYMYSLT